ncbi:MAG TPA: hypothetical protein VLG16_00300 [Candidatus Saccharimonadales bacterium]|nr:hypothetical protein [Candidatus Saccharimonadales bacterium]
MISPDPTKPQNQREPFSLLPSDQLLQAPEPSEPSLISVQRHQKPTAGIGITQASQAQPAQVPDQATIDALLQITRADQQRKDAAHGTQMKHWWNLGEWFNASTASRKKALIRLVIFIVSSIVLSIVADRFVSGAFKGL